MDDFIVMNGAEGGKKFRGNLDKNFQTPKKFGDQETIANLGVGEFGSYLLGAKNLETKRPGSTPPEFGGQL